MQKVLLSKKHQKQETKASCIAASAMMVLEFLGVKVKNEAYLRKILKTKLIGTNVANLLFLKDEKDYNVNVILDYISTHELKEYIFQKQSPLIAILDTEFLSYHTIKSAHAVVVVGFENDKIILNDPWFDEKEIKTYLNEFKLAWGKFGNLVIKIFKK